ncbi:MAG: hypothetical protein JNM07_13480 [Phycisphaerae bacterium]|nr:hypothetical protein [Phycisphaerae bacterium]
MSQTRFTRWAKGVMLAAALAAAGCAAMPGTGGGVRTIEVLGFTGCPNTPTILANTRMAIARLGQNASVAYIDQERLPEGDTRRGWPTPTVLVDGRDLFGMPAPTSAEMGCRKYPGGAPSVDEIAERLGSR